MILRINKNKDENLLKNIAAEFGLKNPLNLTTGCATSILLSASNAKLITIRRGTQNDFRVYFGSANKSDMQILIDAYGAKEKYEFIKQNGAKSSFIFTKKG